MTDKEIKLQKQEEEKQERELERQKSSFMAAKRQCGIRQRYLDADIKKLTDLQKVASEETIDAIYNGKDVLIMGSVGTGKTHLVSALANNFIENSLIDDDYRGSGFYIQYLTEYEIVEMYVQKKFDDFAKLKHGNLIIDEVGKFELEDWKMKHLEELMSNRYNNQAQTIMVTNLNQNDFKTHYGDRLVDRFRDDGLGIIILDGDSLRGADLE